jgi:D-mannonate dehydratase
VPQFHEEFINTGYVDMQKAMKLYQEVGYKGVFIDDHCPMIEGDVEFLVILEATAPASLSKAIFRLC